MTTNKSLFTTLHNAFRSAGDIDRATAQTFAAAVAKHEASGRLSGMEVRVLRWAIWQTALDVFAQRDPEWLTAIKPEEIRR